MRFYNILILAALLITACSGPEIRQQVRERKPYAEAGAQQSQQPASAVSYDPLQVTNQVWAGNKSIQMRRGLPLPTRYENPKAVVLVSGESMSLADVAVFITSQVGVPVRLTDGAEKLGATSAQDIAPANRTVQSRSATQNAANAQASSTSSGDGAAPMTVAYEGPLSGLLDTVAGHFGVSWKYDGAAVVMSRYETRTFVVEAMAGKAEFTDGLQADTGGGSSSTTATTGASSGTSSLDQKSQLTATLDYWTELQETVTTILGGVGAVKGSPSSGTITVITTPEIMRTVAQYIDNENARSTRQVAITVELFTLSLNDSENYGVDFTMLFQDADWPSLGFAGPPIRLSEDDGGQGLSVQVLSPTSKWNGTEAFVRALSTLGNVSRVARIPMTTLNNRPASRRIGRDVGYLASVSTSQSGDSNFLQSTLTPGVVREGFSLQVTPRILGDGRMLVQYSLSVIDLINIAAFPEEGDNQVQLPETSSRVFVQQALLNNGDSLVLSGFDDDKITADNSGFANPYNWVLGGSVRNSKLRDISFVTITPREINVPRRLPNS
ncbi:MAG: hypothetical protein AB7G06_01865 [Bdellovibrionales bacterium]